MGLFDGFSFESGSGNRHDRKAAKLSSKADKALAKGNFSRHAQLGVKANRAEDKGARKGGWL